jgi:hypothetical protein
MSEILHRILQLAARREVLISDHGYDELAADGILILDVYEGVRDGTAVEEYPTYHKGPCVLVCSGITMASQYMYSGGFRAVQLLLPSSSPPIDPIRTGGATIF